MQQNYQKATTDPEKVSQFLQHFDDLLAEIKTIDLTSTVFVEDYSDQKNFDQLIYLDLFFIDVPSQQNPELYLFNRYAYILNKKSLQQLLRSFQESIDNHEIVTQITSLESFDYDKIDEKHTFDQLYLNKYTDDFYKNQLFQKIHFDNQYYLNTLFSILRNESVRFEIEVSSKTRNENTNIKPSDMPLLDQKLSEASLDDSLTYNVFLRSMRQPDYNLSTL